MADLILGPILRYVDAHAATVWIEADAPCEVEILGRRERTFHVAGHHYAIVAIEGLAVGETFPYEVALDGVRRWPQAGGEAPSAITTLAPAAPLRIAFGSCRVAAPHEGPWVLERREDEQGRGVDALQALSHRLRDVPARERPSLLLMIGDQVYADDASPQTRAFIRARRDVEQPPGDEVADFEEYTRLYRESWSEPAIRWLLSTIPSAMIFDDHEVIDDWNISASWKEDVVAQPWWDDRIAGALMSYWLYQHLGNLSPAQLRDDPLLQRLRAAQDGGPPLRAFALAADREPDAMRWSYSRSLGDARLVVIDSRAARRLRGDRREMVSEEHWGWIDSQLRGDTEHLLIVTSLPFLLPHSIHGLEAWNEAVGAGAWGAAAARLAERLRRAVDLEHWAAFQESFRTLAEAVRQVAAGERGRAPASVLVLSGDVHYAYVAAAGYPGRPVTSRVYQAVCSPFRHGLDPPMEIANRVAFSRPMTLIGRVLARSARVPTPPIRWTPLRGPFFDNEVAGLTLDGRQAWIRLDRAPPREVRLECVEEMRLA